MNNYFKILNRIKTLEGQKNELQKYILEAKSLQVKFKRESQNEIEALKFYKQNYVSAYHDNFANSLLKIDDHYRLTIQKRDQFSKQITKQTTFKTAYSYFNKWVKVSSEHIAIAKNYPKRSTVKSNIAKQLPVSVQFRDYINFNQQLPKLLDDNSF